MQEQGLDATTVDTQDSDVQAQIRERVVDLLIYLLKRLILSLSFGTGVLGLLWLLGRIFKR